MNVLAFDLGASSGKLFCGGFGGDRLTLRELHRFKNRPIPLNGGLYWDILSIYSSLTEGIGTAMGERLAIRSIGIDSFSNDFSFLGRRGELLAPVRCYRDDRTARHREAIYGRISPRDLHFASGNQNALFNTVMQLAAMAEDGQRGLLEQADRMLLIPDLLVQFLCGEAASEYTISSVSGMFDFTARTWSRPILEALGLPASMLPPIAEPGHIIGRATPAFREQVGGDGFDVVSVCEHDTASAFLSADAGPDSAIISSGTWSLVGLEHDRPVINEETYRNNIANEGGLERHRLLKNVMGLWLLQELREEDAAAGNRYTFAELGEQALRAPAFQFLIDPDDPLFFTPGHMAGKIRSKALSQSGRRPETTGELARCVLESLAFKYRWVLEQLSHLTGRTLRQICVVGGGSQDRVLCQFTANATGLPVSVGPVEASALGNVAVQLIAHRELAGVGEARALIRRSFPTVTYQPCDTAFWEEQYQRFCRAFGLERSPV